MLNFWFTDLHDQMIWDTKLILSMHCLYVFFKFNRTNTKLKQGAGEQWLIAAAIPQCCSMSKCLSYFFRPPATQTGISRTLSGMHLSEIKKAQHFGFWPLKLTESHSNDQRPL